MLRTGNDLQFQLLGESDFGSVITVQSHTFKDGEEIALHLSIAAFGFSEWRAVFLGGGGCGGGVMFSAAGGERLRGRGRGGGVGEEGLVVCLHGGVAVERVGGVYVVV